MQCGNPAGFPKQAVNHKETDLSKGIKNITTDDKNIVYILDTNGEIKDTLEFNHGVEGIS